MSGTFEQAKLRASIQGHDGTYGNGHTMPRDMEAPRPERDDEGALTCERCGRYLPCRHCPPPHGIRGLARTSGAGEQLSADDVLVTLRMRELRDGNGRAFYVSAANEYSCLSIDARLPEIVSVEEAPPSISNRMPHGVPPTLSG